MNPRIVLFWGLLGVLLLLAYGGTVKADDITVDRNDSGGVVVNNGTVNNFPAFDEQFTPLMVIEDSWNALAELGRENDSPPENDEDIIAALPDFWVNGNPRNEKKAVGWVRRNWYTVQQIARRSEESNPKWRLLIQLPQTVGGYETYIYQGWFDPQLDENGGMALDEHRIPLQKPDLQAYVKLDPQRHQVRWLWSGFHVTARNP
jgi:hypothetical protein